MTAFKLTPAQDKAMDVLVSEAGDIALGGGSRSGKTFLLVRAVIVRALKESESRHVIFRFRFNAIKAAIIYDTLPKVCKLCFPGLWEESTLNKTDWFLSLPNGSEVWFSGLDDKDRVEKVLGQEYCTIYYNECSQIPYTSIITSLTRLAQKTKSLNLKAYYDFNPPSKKHWTYQIFVEHKDPETRKPIPEEEYAFHLINPMDNRDNLDPKYIQRLERLPEKARNRFLLGKFADDTDGALWSDTLLAKTRKLGRHNEPLPEFKRIVVAVDPSGCSGEEDFRSDEIGITVCALGADGHGYLLEDLSGRHSPNDWGQIAVDAYKRHNADRIVPERNFGGAMVEMVVRSKDDFVSFKEVTASRGKTQRAEPIAALYEQDKVHHVGYYPELEEQLCCFMQSGYEGLRSPDRADAAIWGFTELFPSMTETDKEPVELDCGGW